MAFTCRQHLTPPPPPLHPTPSLPIHMPHLPYPTPPLAPCALGGLHTVGLRGLGALSVALLIAPAPAPSSLAPCRQDDKLYHDTRLPCWSPRAPIAPPSACRGLALPLPWMGLGLQGGGQGWWRLVDMSCLFALNGWLTVKGFIDGLRVLWLFMFALVTCWPVSDSHGFCLPVCFLFVCLVGWLSFFAGFLTLLSLFIFSALSMCDLSACLPACSMSFASVCLPFLQERRCGPVWFSCLCVSLVFVASVLFMVGFFCLSACLYVYLSVCPFLAVCLSTFLSHFCQRAHLSLWPLSANILV